MRKCSAKRGLLPKKGIQEPMLVSIANVAYANKNGSGSTAEGTTEGIHDRNTVLNRDSRPASRNRNLQNIAKNNYVKEIIKGCLVKKPKTISQMDQNS